VYCGSGLDKMRGFVASNLLVESFRVSGVGGTIGVAMRSVADRHVIQSVRARKVLDGEVPVRAIYRLLDPQSSWLLVVRVAEAKTPRELDHH